MLRFGTAIVTFETRVEICPLDESLDSTNWLFEILFSRQIETLASSPWRRCADDRL
jgi:hypothetical protein